MSLTVRDFEILEYLHANGVATFTDLRERFFPTENACRLRLSRLGRQGLIQGKPLTDLKQISKSSFYKSKDFFIMEGRSSMHKLKVYCLGEKVRAKSPAATLLSEPFFWKHQLQLARVQKVFEHLLPGALFLTDPQVRESWRAYKMGKKEIVPDLVVQKDDLRVAVEVERNLKSEMDYYSRFLSYKDSSYSHIIYYCESERVFQTLVEHSSWISKIACAQILSPKNVFQKAIGFQRLDQFLGLGR